MAIDIKRLFIFWSKKKVQMSKLKNKKLKLMYIDNIIVSNDK